MKVCKLLLATAGTTLLLAIIISAGASAGRLSFSSSSIRLTWRRWDFNGGFGTVECELILEKSLHARTMIKEPFLLIGYTTGANVARCARGGATMLRETLPWHWSDSEFEGTLPNITHINTLLIGASFTVREPTFGVTCLTHSILDAPWVVSYNREVIGGAPIGATNSGTIVCGSFNGAVRGTTSTLDNGSGARLTVTLI